MKSLTYIPLLLGLLSLAACSDNGDDDEDCLNPKYKVPLLVNVNVDNSFHDYRQIDSISLTRATKNTDDVPYLKYFVAAYPANPKYSTEIASSSSNKVPISIHPGKYTLVGWVSYESSLGNRCINFYTDDFDELLLKNKYNYSGANPLKLAFRGAVDVGVAYNDTSKQILARPAMALYRLEATDSARFTPGKVLVKYSSPLPAAINAKTGEINWWWNDISYSPEIDGKLIASDYVFSQDSETSVIVTVEIYNQNGRLCARKKNLEIPLINGGITTIRGNFYSIKELDNAVSSGSGISVKTEWDATFEIEL